MRAWEMHPLCCLAGEWPASGGGHAPPEPADEGAAPAVAGVLYKWTNIGKGWRLRWLAIRGGVLAYSKIRRRVAAEPHPAPEAAAAGGVRMIGVACGSAGERPIGFVHLKQGAFQRPQKHSKHRAKSLLNSGAQGISSRKSLLSAQLDLDVTIRQS